jgi:hypothetical protein
MCQADGLTVENGEAWTGPRRDWTPRSFSLVPNDVSLPRFRARIDDGNPGRRRDPELDIDIAGVSDKIKRDFNAKRNDYAGHHNDRSPSREQRVFEVKIVVPAGVVFDGDVSFSAHFPVLLEASVSSTVRIETTRDTRGQ